MADLRRILDWRVLAGLVGYLVAAAVIAAPIAAEQAVERVSFDDRVGTLPVEVSLCHNGFSTIDTGILGKVYWRRTGAFGFGACLRATEPPEAGGTLTSYADPKFVKTNAQLVNDPETIAGAYGREFVRSFRDQFLKIEALLCGLGLLVVFAIRRGRSASDVESPPGSGARLADRLALGPRTRRVLWPTLLVVLGTSATTAYAAYAFRHWPGDAAVGTTYPLPGVERLSFSSPQTREVAAQVQPFIEKNTQRLKARSAEFESKAEASLATALAPRAAELTPRAGERVVLAEADPQGSFVGTVIRTKLYPRLRAALGQDAITLRTISGDVSSNGTVAEDGFIKDEAAASGSIPTAAVAGDHDSDATVAQMRSHGITVPDLQPVEVDGIRVVGGDDPEFKTLFGGTVTNPSGVSETALGQRLRDVVDPFTPVVVLLHQPAAAAAYLGIDDLGILQRTAGHDTTPYDDGIPDLPPGVVNVGHRHQPLGPWVIWNTDTDNVTWTVVDQLGTAGGVENSPTFNRFSTPFSVPLKPVSIRLQYLDDRGLETGYASISIDTDGTATVSPRTDVGLVGTRSGARP